MANKMVRYRHNACWAAPAFIQNLIMRPRMAQHRRSVCLQGLRDENDILIDLHHQQLPSPWLPVRRSNQDLLGFIQILILINDDVIERISLFTLGIVP